LDFKINTISLDYGDSAVSWNSRNLFSISLDYSFPSCPLMTFDTGNIKRQQKKGKKKINHRKNIRNSHSQPVNPQEIIKGTVNYKAAWISEEITSKNANVLIKENLKPTRLCCNAVCDDRENTKQNKSPKKCVY